MPTFFFHVDDGEVRAVDADGVELPNFLAAAVEAASLAGELLRDRPRQFWTTQEWKLAVEDSSGLALFTIVVAATVAPAVSAMVPQRKQA